MARVSCVATRSDPEAASLIDTQLKASRHLPTATSGPYDPRSTLHYVGMGNIGCYLGIAVKEQLTSLACHKP